MMNIIYIAHAHTNRKDDIFMQRRLYIDEAHTAMDIFRFAVSLLMRIDFVLCPNFLRPYQPGGGIIGVLGNVQNFVVF